MSEEKEKISPTNADNADFDKLLKEVLESDDQMIEEEQDIEETDEFDDSLLKEETNLELTDEEEPDSYLEDEDISIDE